MFILVYYYVILGHFYFGCQTQLFLYLVLDAQSSFLLE